MKLGYENTEIIRADFRSVLSLDAWIDASIPMCWSVAVVELLHAFDQIRRGNWRPDMRPITVLAYWIGPCDGELKVRVRMPRATFGSKVAISQLLEHARRTAMEHEREGETWNV